MPTIKDADWVLKDIQEVEDEAMKVIRNSTEHNLVLAGPGAGKTELLAQKACYLIETGKCSKKKIIALSFKKDAAKNLQDRVNSRLDSKYRHKFESTTFDAFCKSIVDRFKSTIPEAYRPSDDYEIIFPNNKNFVEEIKKEAVGFEGLTSAELNKLQPYNFEENYIVTPYDKKTEHTVDGRIRSFVWSYLLKPKSRLSFKMINFLANYIISKNKYLSNAINSTYDYAFIDEFQDTTYRQYEIFKSIFLGKKIKITAVGDTKQRIMGWAGAMHNAFEVFKKDFEIEQPNELVSNRRSLKNLISYQRMMEAFMNHADIKPDMMLIENEGSAKLLQFEESTIEGAYVALCIQKWIAEGVNERDICILLRNPAKQYTDDIISALQYLKIQCRLENEYQDLLNEAVVQLVLQMLMFVCNRKSIESWATTMELLCNIRGVSKRGDITRLEKELSQFIKSHRVIKEEILDYLYSLLSIFGVDKIKSYFPQYMSGNGLEYSIELLSRHLDKLDVKNKISEAIDLLLGNKTIPLMTIHKSKGLEFKKVIVVGLEPGAYFGNEEEQIENQKTVFVAFSRAIEEVLMTRCKIRNNSYGRSFRQNCNEIPLITNMITYCGIEAEDYQS
ncbi:TPA: ATP-dependent helicase [Salmonella enterica subsp. enterica serovar Enteritidis]|uniref:DNA 3'-5' helicase n=2 Tax=Enterobacteriaceae TaxID=543 RepID=A0A3Z2NY98_SALEN|nr:ATP-dependent helicase [Salmonella enterica subsp. enterica serovar Enteritidis]EED5699503.1 ATP-dependent helicase [Salmonella enterica subsp. enterica serovar Enteritidis]HAB3423563.1 ATP-dependent helicase [Salmonella enterica subsp. enterica serovar Enteritidis]HED9361041.1 ATP-dependent helicase [Salmonella enterica subsp. enterica serovar Enteritidis]